MERQYRFKVFHVTSKFIEGKNVEDVRKKAERMGLDVRGIVPSDPYLTSGDGIWYTGKGELANE